MKKACAGMAVRSMALLFANARPMLPATAIQRTDNRVKSRIEPAGVHFFDRKTGLNILLDEIQKPEHEWAIAPRYMSISLANACDLHCSFCFASKLPHRVSSERVLAWSQELDSHGCFGIGFGGGEPTLYTDLVPLCRSIVETTELAITMTTHGHHFTPALADALRGIMPFIRVSMDGIGTTYEALRGRSFADFSQKLEIVRSAAPFGINYVVNSDTIADLDAAAEFVFSAGATELLLLPEMDNYGNLRLSENEMEHLHDWVNANYGRFRLSMSQPGAESIGINDVLPVSNTADRTYDFLHIDASMMLRKSAFENTGMQLTNSSVLIDSIRLLRNQQSPTGAQL
jgi:pyruvate-formate lyase-activating enzyme